MRNHIHEIGYLRIDFLLRQNRIADMLVCFHDGTYIELGFAPAFDFQGIDIRQYLFQSIDRAQILR